MVGLGEIARGEGLRYLQTHFVTPRQHKALIDIAECRTAALGTVSNTCDDCGAEYWLFCSCRNRCCPLCQGEAQRSWFEAREEEILPVPYLHMVFTLPRELKVLARYCPVETYNALIRSAGQAVIDVGRSKLHLRLGTLVELQTWDQNMGFHPHAHAAVPAGGFSEDGTRWVSFELKDLPAKTLANRFRTLLCRNLLKAERRGKLSQLPPTLSVEQLLARVKDRQWESTLSRRSAEHGRCSSIWPGIHTVWRSPTTGSCHMKIIRSHSNAGATARAHSMDRSSGSAF